MFRSSLARRILPLVSAMGLVASLRGAGDAAERETRTGNVRIRIVSTARTEGELAPCG